MMRFSVLVSTIAVLANVCSGAIFDDPKFVASKQYDFIVVGAGTAGCVIAARLSEDPRVNVLVIEAGLSDVGPDNAALTIPFLAGQAIGTQFDWNYTTVDQAGLNGRAIPYPRGHVLGGSSQLNAMIYFRGPSEDFDRFASVSGDDGWSWKNIYPYALKTEKHVSSWNNLNDTGKYNPAVHGYGPVLTSLTGDPTDLDARAIKATQQLSGEFPFNLDLNSGNGLGIGWVQTSVGNSVRSSSSTSYLHPALTARSNIDVVIQTQVTQLVQTDKASSAFRGVKFSQGKTSKTYTLTASKEVILSAGSIGTPQLLLLSGIGPKKSLEQVGITSLVDLPDVGKNMQDQPIFFVQSAVSVPTLSSVLRNQTLLGEALAQYEANKMGLMASNVVVNTIGFLRLPGSSPALKKYGDPSAGSHSPHYTLSFLGTFAGNVDQVSPVDGEWMSVSMVLQTPTSRGSVGLLTTSAFDYPQIDPAFLSTNWDIAACIEVVRELAKFLSAPVWKNYLIGPFMNGLDLSSDAAIEDFVRRSATTLKHPVGTAKVSKASDSDGVVGPQLTVKNTKGLRIVDASVLPFAVEGFPQAEIYMIAERAAAIIKSTYGLN